MLASTVAAFLKSLEIQAPPNAFNPWMDHDPGTDLESSAPSHRLERLKAHLSVDAKYVLVGEAAGYQGCKVTGIAFTSERLLIEGAIPRVRMNSSRLSTRPRPWSEPSATIVWGTLHELGIADRTVLWNACPWHPHQPGNVLSNRTPKGAEKAAGLAMLAALLDLYPESLVFAAGRNAERALADIGRPATGLRHPAMGGATLFRRQLRDAVQRLDG